MNKQNGTETEHSSKSPIKTSGSNKYLTNPHQTSSIQEYQVNCEIDILLH
jgi:hypothetical protein